MCRWPFVVGEDIISTLCQLIFSFFNLISYRRGVWLVSYLFGWCGFGLVALVFSTFVVVDLDFESALEVEGLICMVTESLNDNVLWVWFVIDFDFNVFVDFSFLGMWLRCVGIDGLFIFWHNSLGWVCGGFCQCIVGFDFIWFLCRFVVDFT